MNGGAPYTVSTAVTLECAVSDAAALQMRFRNSDDASWSSWEPYAAGKDWTLTAVDGSKTVEAQFRDAVGNMLPLSETILLDGTPPSVRDDAGSAWHRVAVSVHLSALDGESGPAKTRYRRRGSDMWLDATDNAFTVRGNANESYEYRALDFAGNASSVGTCTVRSDTTRPRPKAPHRAVVKRHGWVTIRFRVNDRWPRTGFATVTLRFKTTKGKTLKTVVLQKRKVNTELKYRFRCVFRKGTHRFYVSATDAAGNRQHRPAGNRLLVR